MCRRREYNTNDTTAWVCRLRKTGHGGQPGKMGQQMKRNIQFRNCRACVRFLDLVILTLLMLVACPAGLSAKPVGAEQAENVVRGWLKTYSQPLGAALGRQIGHIETFTGDDGEAIYYVVYLKPAGYVIVPADDCLEPILCFVETGLYEATDAKPLAALVSRDVPARIAAVRALQAAAGGGIGLQRLIDDNTALQETVSDAQAKRGRLSAGGSSVTIMGLPGVSDIRVVPLTQSTWGQTTIGSFIGGISCYNYYTLPYGLGHPDNYPIGCVAAAMSQLMRYHEHPVGTYTWSNMPLQPDNGITPTQQRAIGQLCYDAAQSIGTVYGPGGSSASLNDADERLPGTFGYSNSIIAMYPTVGIVLNNMVNSNLDAGLPVLLGFDGGAGGHSVICDGYGYNASTLYHHLNMGWSGHDNAWYALPVVDASSYYYAINTCIYNIFTSGSGEIISGRAIDIVGNPIPDVQITATPTGSSPRYASTNGNGVFAVTGLLSNKYVALTAYKPPHTFANRGVSTGRSTDNSTSSGNVWGVTFVSTSNTPPTAYAGSEWALAGTTKSISLYATDDGHPNPPGRITYKIVVLPLHGSLSDPAGGKITTVPHTLANYGNTANYWPCTYYSGPDTFYFAANDGGTPPEAGDSDPAAVTIDVENTVVTTFAPQTHSAAPWPFGTSWDDSRTQVIYLSSEIGGPKTITALALDVYERPGYPNLNYWTIRMKHTTRSAYNSPPYFETGGWTIVYFGHEGCPTTGWYEYEFQTPFEYNGTGNLMIDFSHDNNGNSGPDSDGFCTATQTYETRVVLGFSDSWHGDPTSWNDDTFYPYYPYWATAVPNIRLTSTITAEPILGDIVQNCSVDIVDLVVLCDSWLSSPGDPDWYPACDISDPQDDFINELDFAVFAEHWGESTE